MYTMTGWINVVMGIINFILFLPWSFKEHTIAIKEAMRNGGKATGKKSFLFFYYYIFSYSYLSV